MILEFHQELFYQFAHCKFAKLTPKQLHRATTRYAYFNRAALSHDAPIKGRVIAKDGASYPQTFAPIADKPAHPALNLTKSQNFEILNSEYVDVTFFMCVQSANIAIRIFKTRAEAWSAKPDAVQTRSRARRTFLSNRKISSTCCILFR